MILYEDLHLVPSYAKAHGILMSLAFVIIFPLGATLVRVLKFKNVLWVHISIQIIGWGLMLGGLATGLRVGKILDRLHNNAHTILGTIIVVFMLIQPFLGAIHHYLFTRRKKTTFLAPLHVWLGRILILLGLINGGLGLRLANNSDGGKIAYAVTAGFCGIAYIAVAMSYQIRRADDKENPVENIEVQETRK